MALIFGMLFVSLGHAREELANRPQKRCLIAAIFAVSLTALHGLLCQIFSDGPSFFAILILPFYAIGAWLSGSIHAPSPVGVFGSEFLFFIVGYLVLSFFAFPLAYEARRKNQTPDKA